MYAAQKPCHRNKRGFTLVEIMVVVVIIGLLASIAIPSFIQSRRSATASRIANDFKAFSEKFIMYNLAYGEWPVDGYPGTIPAGMEQLSNTAWPQTTPLGGRWDWNFEAIGVTAGIAISNANPDPQAFLAIDSLIDDGNLSNGYFVQVNAVTVQYILEL